MKNSTYSTSEETTKSADPWAVVKKQYKLKKHLGAGAFGDVYKAKHLKTNETVAIKMIKTVDRDVYTTRKILRECVILRKLTEIKGNIFTTKLHQIILPEGCNPCLNAERTHTEISDEDIQNLDHLFLVLDLVETDFKILMEKADQVKIDATHVKTLLYNQLCALNFLHSANIIHRDIKPGNMLVDSNCGVKICDFGLARTMPERPDQQKKLKQQTKKYFNDYMKCDNFEERQSNFNQFKNNISETLISQKNDRKNRPRDMTECVQTRWYRSPEIIVTEKDYDQSIDIWSLGVSLAEMIRCSSQTHKSSSRFLFKGRSCFPISPSRADKQEVDKDDQFFKILEKYSDADLDTDFSFMSSDEALGYVKEMKKQANVHQGIKDSFPKQDSELIEILSLMLQINPYMRPSASQLLRSPYFDDIRIKVNEEKAPYKIKMKIDSGEDRFSYEDESQDTENEQIRLIKQIIKESLKHKVQEDVREINKENDKSL